MPKATKSNGQGNATWRDIWHAPRSAIYAGRPTKPVKLSNGDELKFGQTGTAVPESRTVCWFYPDCETNAATSARVPIGDIYLESFIAPKPPRLQSFKLTLVTSPIVARAKNLGTRARRLWGAIEG